MFSSKALETAGSGGALVKVVATSLAAFQPIAQAPFEIPSRIAPLVIHGTISTVGAQHVLLDHSSFWKQMFVSSVVTTLAEIAKSQKALEPRIAEAVAKHRRRLYAR